ncbi:MAG: HEAT repeat domain-containing protein, partial [Acidobacteriia bacterium]|nr:HEAT repeat domain-containing protein [Terriglobia bacterium]
HWLRAQLESTNGRMRASAVEALCGVEGSYSRKHLIGCLKDEHNRVVGNALFGLHLLREPAVDRSLEMMRHDARASFRQTAAWVMGKIGKPEFTEALQMAGQYDDEEAVRISAARFRL